MLDFILFTKRNQRRVLTRAIREGRGKLEFEARFLDELQGSVTDKTDPCPRQGGLRRAKEAGLLP